MKSYVVYTENPVKRWNMARINLLLEQNELTKNDK